MAVEPEPPPDDSVEALDEEVCEEVRRRVVLGAVELVAVRAGEAGVALEVGAAMRVGDDRVVAGRRLLDGGADPLRPVVQLGRHRAHVDVPAAAGGDLLHVQRECAAADDHPSHPGNASSSMNRSLKSARPDSSTYSTSSSTAFAAARSVTDSAAIFAPSPATLPAATMRASGNLGTRPILTALEAVRNEPNEPPRSTWDTSSGSMPSSLQRIVHPVAIE